MNNMKSIPSTVKYYVCVSKNLCFCRSDMSTYIWLSSAWKRLPKWSAFSDLQRLFTCVPKAKTHRKGCLKKYLCTRGHSLSRLFVVCTVKGGPEQTALFTPVDHTMCKANFQNILIISVFTPGFNCLQSSLFFVVVFFLFPFLLLHHHKKLSVSRAV